MATIPKELKIKLAADTSEADEAIKRLRDKLTRAPQSLALLWYIALITTAILLISISK